MKAPDKVYVYCDHEGNPDKVDIYPLGKRSVGYINESAILDAIEHLQKVFVDCGYPEKAWYHLKEELKSLGAKIK